MYARVLRHTDKNDTESDYLPTIKSRTRAKTGGRGGTRTK